MAIWNQKVTVEDIAPRLKNTMCEHLDMQITEVGDDYLVGTMPVDNRTQQFMGIVHGGASVALAESLGSLAANLCCKPGFYCVGLDINANHTRPGRPPLLTGITRPLHIGNSTMVWEIRITDSEEKLVCISRLTTAVLESGA